MSRGRALRVGLIGYGYSGKTFHAPLIGATPGLKLTTVVSSDAAKVRADLPEVRVWADPMALFAAQDVDLIVIASPNATHFDLAQAALLANKPVVVDKPFVQRLEEARTLLTLAHKRGILLSVFHNRRWDSDYLSIKQAIVAGLIGEVTHFESHFDRFRPTVRQRWREMAGPGGGVWADLGPHLVDQALQLFGLPERVLASFASQRPGALVEDWSHVVLDYGARRVVLHAAMLAAGGVHRFLVHGQKGTLVKRKMDLQEAQLAAGQPPGYADWGVDPDDLLFYDAAGTEHKIATERGDQRQFYYAINAALRGDAENPVAAAQIIAVVAVMEAAACSAKLGTASAIHSAALDFVNHS